MRLTCHHKVGAGFGGTQKLQKYSCGSYQYLENEGMDPCAGPYVIQMMYNTVVPVVATCATNASRRADPLSFQRNVDYAGRCRNVSHTSRTLGVGQHQCKQLKTSPYT